MDYETIIDVRDLAKVYKLPTAPKIGWKRIISYFIGLKQDILALNNVSFHVRKGEIYGVLGPNGSGKTTLIRALAGIVSPDIGLIYVNGLNVRIGKNKDALAKELGVILGERSRSIYWRLTGKQNLEFFGSLYSIPKKKMKKKIERLLKEVGLYERKDDYVFHYSTGMKNRLAIARALLHDPKILLLDEPTANLDSKAARDLRKLIKELTEKRNKTVVVTSASANEIENLCDRIGILHEGKIIAEGTIRELKRNLITEGARLFVEVGKHPRKLLEGLKKQPGIGKVSVKGKQLTVSVTDHKRVPKIIEYCNRKGVLACFNIIEPSLEEAFVEAIRKHASQ